MRRAAATESVVDEVDIMTVTSGSLTVVKPVTLQLNKKLLRKPRPLPLFSCCLRHRYFIPVHAVPPICHWIPWPLYLKKSFFFFLRQFILLKLEFQNIVLYCVPASLNFWIQRFLKHALCLRKNNWYVNGNNHLLKGRMSEWCWRDMPLNEYKDKCNKWN